MKLPRVFMVIVVGLVLVGAAYMAQKAEPPTAARVAGAAQKLVDSFTAEQKTKAMFTFNDKEHVNWNFVPLQDKERKSTRKGLPMEEMTGEQKAAARGLVKAATSDSGFQKATTIMGLENLLHDWEKNGVMVRNPGWYFFTFFGEPSKTGKWGFRVEGHHLSLNFTLDQGQVISYTPFFFGANPAEIMAGERKGEKVLPDVDGLAQELYQALDKEQQKEAYHGKQYEEIEQGKAAPQVGKPSGLVYGKMNEKQQALIRRLIKSYLNRAPSDLAEGKLAEVEKAGLENIYFGFYREESKPGKPFTYRVQGPNLLIEFLKVQEDSAKNPANHIHSSLRNPKGDFGMIER
jgi:hypothetical protein